MSSQGATQPLLTIGTVVFLIGLGFAIAAMVATQHDTERPSISADSYDAAKMSLKVTVSVEGLCSRPAHRRVRRRAGREQEDRRADEDDAQAALEDALRDEPDWVGVLSVVPIELDERDGELSNEPELTALSP